jgi:hypothetical protein
MPTFVLELSDASAQWLKERASSRGISTGALLSQLVDEASRHSSLTWEENLLLRCFNAVGAEQGAPVPIETLLHFWSRLAPGMSDSRFGVTFDSLTGKNLVFFSSGPGVAGCLTPAGYRASLVAHSP